jgi:hypothetical protein
MLDVALFNSLFMRFDKPSDLLIGQLLLSILSS